MKVLYRASIFYFIDNDHEIPESQFQFFLDGGLVIEDGLIVDCNEYDLIKSEYGNIQEVDYSGKLIMPGMIDTHIHFPQVEIVASYGEQLLDWLNNYTFPCEKQFEDKQYAENMAQFFLDELLKNGTTTALVFGTVHKQSVEAFFEASHKLNTRMICGKVMMNRNAPEYLCDTVQSSFDDSKELIENWHEKGRQLYAVTPRFAITSTDEQLKKAGELIELYPSVYMHSHISENKDEISFTKSLYPNHIDYLDIYDSYGLLTKKTVLAHGIHLTERELTRLAQTQSSISFCPTSNLFLGSGLLNIETLENHDVSYSVATDIGGGTSFSMFTTLSEAYKISQLNDVKLSALKGLYLATLGNAKSLHLNNKIGSFKKGNEADFIVIEFNSTKLMELRQSKCKTLEEKLFSLMILGDERNIFATYVFGNIVYSDNVFESDT